jgi:hypothetical protein
MNPSSPRVGVVSRANDPCVALVRRALAARGAELVDLLTARFPTDTNVSIALGDDALALEFAGVDLRSLRALWLRHPVLGELPTELPDDERAACAGQCEAALWAALGCFEGYVLDPVESLLAAPGKPQQLALARRCGLDVPRTLVTNDASAVRAFAAHHADGVVCKLIESGALGLTREGGGTRSFPTTRLTDEDLASLDGLNLSPMIFQELIPKALEARVTVVGREMFVAAVAPGDVVDVRTDPSLIASLRPYDGVPEPVRVAILRMLDRLSLDFATADLARTPDGRWVFFEINTVSFFDHVEAHAGLPISSAVADLLLGLRPSRAHRSP